MDISRPHVDQILHNSTHISKSNGNLTDTAPQQDSVLGPLSTNSALQPPDDVIKNGRHFNFSEDVLVCLSQALEKCLPIKALIGQKGPLV